MDSCRIEIFNQVNEEIPELDTVQKVLYSAIEKEGLENTIFNLIIVDNEYIHELNRDYRNIDRETDVITFALEDDKTFNPEIRILGDVYISIDKAKSQSIEYGHSLLRELCFLAVHGMLHLLGYDHMQKDEEKIMFNLQEEILDEMGIKRQ
jgi:probable rRNA maturation factor